MLPLNTKSTHQFTTPSWNAVQLHSKESRVPENISSMSSMRWNLLHSLLLPVLLIRIPRLCSHEEGCRGRTSDSRVGDRVWFLEDEGSRWASYCQRSRKKFKRKEASQRRSTSKSTTPCWKGKKKTDSINWSRSSNLNDRRLEPEQADDDLAAAPIALLTNPPK
jgi:hypothetical protein